MARRSTALSLALWPREETLWEPEPVAPVIHSLMNSPSTPMSPEPCQWLILVLTPMVPSFSSPMPLNPTLMVCIRYLVS